VHNEKREPTTDIPDAAYEVLSLKFNTHCRLGLMVRCILLERTE